VHNGISNEIINCADENSDDPVRTQQAIMARDCPMLVALFSRHQSKDLRFFDVDDKLTLRDVLLDCEIVEFPTIYVFPKASF